MPGKVMTAVASADVPSWVPESALRYLAHTEEGQSIRALARMGGCHASTVLRQIRRVENLRDDLLVDEALKGLGRAAFRRTRAALSHKDQNAMNQHEDTGHDHLPDTGELQCEARRVLRRLNQPGAVLAVAGDMEKAVIVRDTASGTTERLAVLDRSVAQALALKDWISCDAPGRVSRYRITSSGRSELNRLMLAGTGAGQGAGLAEAPAGFRHAQSAGVADDDADYDDAAARRRVRYGQPDTPVAMLARRRDRDGKPFLEDALVRAGERLAEDFELSQMGPRTTQNWDQFLTAGVRRDARGDAGGGADAARDRVARALRELGPGLGDVVLRCCCYQQGLETAEKSMGWSARSGKIVLRIALQRLRQHYDGLGDAGGLMG